MISAVFDTMVWVAALRNRRERSAARLILEACFAGGVDIIISRELLEENIEVLFRPRLQIPPADALSFGSFLASHSRIVTITGTPQGCPDPNDDMLFETARNGKATYIVSLDKKVHALKAHALETGINVVTIAEFLDVLRTATVVTGNAVEPEHPKFSELLNV